MSDFALELQQVCAGYGENPVINQLNFKAARGEFIAIIGSNGAGKSTLFRMILGLLPLSAGKIIIQSHQMDSKKDFDFIRTKIGFVPQGVQGGNLPITVLESVMLGNWGASFSYWRRPTAEDKEKAAKWLEYVGLTNLASKDCRRLSGGQRQRMNIARALIREPDILLLDEPITHLDKHSQEILYSLLAACRQQIPHLLILMITHQLEEAAPLTDRIYLMEKGQLIEVGEAP
ncbi:metal ABC transporter ATP-binding protein [Paenibacillus sinopodophylli]|uniref:metal ABC transporter ATP-binding protein n=1 Tax=Paenibacillus sinopodophylli TaxID=1837342 RepID=UPI001486C0E5|nr:metal ABC transporter ATP-binding protein [Paenibacillus sinopodophylli]